LRAEVEKWKSGYELMANLSEETNIGQIEVLTMQRDKAIESKYSALDERDDARAKVEILTAERDELKAEIERLKDALRNVYKVRWANDDDKLGDIIEAAMENDLR